MGISGSWERFLPADARIEHKRIPRVGDRVEYRGNTAEVEFIGEETVAFKDSEEAKNPTPGRRVAVYEAVRGSEFYRKMSEDPAYTEARSAFRAGTSYAEVSFFSNGRKRIVVAPLDQLEAMQAPV